MFNIYDVNYPTIQASTSSGNEESGLSRPGDELPSYSTAGPSRLQRHTSRERQLHEFTLEDSDKRPWAYLRLRSWAPSGKSLPVFLEDQDVSGHVELDLRQPESIKCVEVSIRGIVRTYNKETAFYEASETLWDNSLGDPRNTNRRSSTKFTGKLQGTYQWTFSITLPHEFPVEPKLVRKLKLSRIEHLPPSLDGLGGTSVINYRLTANIKRRGILKPHSSISTLIGYTPTTRPGPPSAARATAYRERTPVPGPVFDPDGWRLSENIKFSGTLFKQRNVDVMYTLALATPLEYTRGTVIPCHLSIRTSDKQALDLLSNPSSPRVTLRRKLTARTVATPSERIELATLRGEDSRPLAKAIWATWERRPNECSLMGELTVPLACIPTFSFGEISLEYFVDLQPPMPTGFQPASDEALSSTLIRVVSAHSEDSPRPRAYITPVFDASQRVDQSDASGTHRALGRTSSLEPVISGFASRPATSHSIGASSRPRFDTYGRAQVTQDVNHPVTPSSPTGSRRLNRRFSAL